MEKEKNSGSQMLLIIFIVAIAAFAFYIGSPCH